jgi:hypothetical protein
VNESEVIERLRRFRIAMLTGFARKAWTKCDPWPTAANGRELLDVLIASLAMTQAPVTSSERDELRTLAEAMDLPTDQLAGLNAQG